MGTVSYTPPNDGTEIKAKHLRDLWIALSGAVNGNIDSDNVDDGSLTAAKLAGEIPATKMTDSGDLELFINETMSDHVISGCVWSIDSGLTADMTSGYIRINGIRYSISAVSNNVFLNNKDIYCDVGIDGVVDYNDVATGATAPSLAADHVRLAIVKTSAGAITSIQSMAVNPGFLTDGFQELTRTTITGAGDTITVSSIPARKYLKVLFYATDTGGTIGGSIRFNNDSGTNYAERYSVNGGADATTSSQTAALFRGGTGAFPQFVTGEIINIAAEEKVVNYIGSNQSTDGGANLPNSIVGFAKWANKADRINRIDVINAGTGDFAIGSGVIVLGKD